METGSTLLVKPEHDPEYGIELGENLSIGRAQENRFVIDREAVSRHHAEIRCSGLDRYVIVDLGSANGTWLNGRRVSAHRELKEGDEIVIGELLMVYRAGEGGGGASGPEVGMASTPMNLISETVVVLVSDIRNYTGMSEVLPAKDFCRLTARWFRKSGEIIERYGGTVDKFVGDAVKAYWIIRDPDEAGLVVDNALTAARDTLLLSHRFSEDLTAKYESHAFRIGIGLNFGPALLADIGAGINPSLTAVGDTINVAFRLESLTKEKGFPVLVSSAVAEKASQDFKFEALGDVEIKGRRKSVSVLALEMGSSDHRVSA